MNRRNLALAAGSALLGGALAVLSGRLGSAETAGTFSAPVRWLGSGLRALSLSGFWGNLAAWLLVLLVCAVPVLLVLWCGRWKGGWKAEDWLAVEEALLVSVVEEPEPELPQPAKVAVSSITAARRDAIFFMSDSLLRPLGFVVGNIHIIQLISRFTRG